MNFARLPLPPASALGFLRRTSSSAWLQKSRALAAGLFAAVACAIASPQAHAQIAQYSTCSGLYSLTSPAVAPVNLTGSYAYLAQQQDIAADGSTGTSGHLTAQAITANGTLNPIPAWDAASLMTLAQRQNLLFTQGASGNLITLSSAAANLSLLPATVAAQMAPNGADAINALINPNYQSGAWLAGRSATSLMGRPLRSAPFIAGQAVVVGAEDGFLYGFDKSTGALLWGFIPPNLLPKTKTAGALIGANPWGQGSYATSASAQTTTNYILATAMQGAEHVALKIAASGALQSVAWEDYEVATTSPASPVGGAAPTVAIDQSGSASANVAYIVGQTFKRVALADGGNAQLTVLATTPTSNPIYLSDTAAYYGDSQGNVKGLLGAADAGNLNESATNPVIWLTGAFQNALGGAGTLGAANVLLVGASTTAAEVFSMGNELANPAPAGVALWQFSATSSTGVPNLPSGDLISALPTIANGYVFLGLTQGADICAEQAFEVGPLALATGQPILARTAFRQANVSSAINGLGTGEAVFATPTILNGASITIAMANGGGTATAATGWAPYTYVDADKGNVNRRLDWRELTNFILDAVIGSGA